MAWVAVGLSGDVRRGMAIPACVAGVDLAIWRSASGTVQAWGDRCPHRGMRLSQGFVRGETLACIYHGWQYGRDGGCAYIPAHPDLIPPKSIRATTYDCRDKGGLIWVALTETTAAPPELRGASPVRSVPVDAPLRVVAEYFGDPVAMVISAGDVTLVLQPAQADRCMVHVLTQADPKAASRWIEDRRAVIEGAAA